MKKLALLALAILLALGLSGCAQDEAKLMESVAIRVGSISYTYADVLSAENANRAYYDQLNQLYAMYGITGVAMTDEEIRNEVVNNLSTQAVVLDKAHQMGLTELTEDEQRELSRRTTATMKEYRASAEAGLTLPEDATAQDREAAIDAALLEAGVTREKVYRSEWEAYIIEKAQNWAVSDVTVSEAEFLAAFNERVESEKATMDADVTQYGLTILNGETPLYAPAGYRELDWIYIAASEDAVEQLYSIEDALDAAVTDADNCEETARGLLGDEADLDALVAQVDVTLSEVTDTVGITVQEAVAAFDTELAEDAAAAVIALAKACALEAAYQQQLDLAVEASKAAIAPEVEEALRRLENGESWDLVQEHYNDDTEMYPGSPVVCADFPYVTEDYLNASMALTAPGQWTQGVYDDGYGCYIILYTGDVAQGAVDAETVREAMTAELLATRQEESFSQTLNLWIEAANYRIYINYDLLGN